ncbi:MULTISPECIES: hypothetical protein [Yersinia pseudotuberculosis complex]|uniref:Fumarate hydratase n=13 Tax=Gammaproteobacteria TaxID=1236 RepID=A0AAX2HZP9_YERPE|nr:MULTISPECIES: hypothetical protein [Yersinia pseudotuberculosis complex]EDR32169.1 conserved hypothetical protein [Yersinia pestis biovar Orientalis str. IP275]EFA49631.1 conserved hypothetical protein [Yersinia pestis KIM D27]ERP74376.1 hypothetical protein L327_08140 [Yersinia pestis S3]ERP75092.1 hypothetical protein L328_08095 [Yersinia pestis 24H]CQD49625.1 Uncharacterised protein [Yersinia intermedia]
MSSINQTSVRAHTGETGANLPGEDHLIAHEALLVALMVECANESDNDQFLLSIRETLNGILSSSRYLDANAIANGLIDEADDKANR